jgi:hypothetical protein
LLLVDAADDTKHVHSADDKNPMHHTAYAMHRGEREQLLIMLLAGVLGRGQSVWALTRQQ